MKKTEIKTINRMQSFFAAGLLTLAASMCPETANAQLSSNKDKFLGNITTSYQIDYGNEKFYKLWNQITPENETKWDAVEGSRRGSFNFNTVDNIYNYSLIRKFPFKWHTLIWGAQYPSWMDKLTSKQQLAAIEEWMDAIKKKYPNLPLIDVVNEAIPGHQPAPYKDALGGDGKTGYDWIIKAFEMAHERWPNAILIYNDFNTFQWQKTEFINLVKILRNSGAPIDAYGCQSHDLTDMNASSFKSAMNEIQNALKIPMYSTEYDIGTSDDNLQLQRYKEQIPYMWESDYVAGITLWGYIYGRTWTTDGNSGLIKNGVDRPAMTWLREYMKTDAAKNAKSPYPNMKKVASIYIKPESLNGSKGTPMPITVNARLNNKTIDRVELYVGNKLIETLTESPYKTEYTPTIIGNVTLKAVVYDTEGNSYERYGGFTSNKPRAPFTIAIPIPGIIQAENFDSGSEGEAYHDSDSKNEGTTSYRSNGGGVDIVTSPSGYALGYTQVGEWTEYTVNVSQAGEYSYEAYCSSGVDGSGFSIGRHEDDGTITNLCDINVTKTAEGTYNTYKTFKGNLSVPLKEGKQILRFTITGTNCNIDRVRLKCEVPDGIEGIEENDKTGVIYNISGQKVDDNYKGIVIINGKKFLRK